MGLLKKLLYTLLIIFFLIIPYGLFVFVNIYGFEESGGRHEAEELIQEASAKTDQSICGKITLLHNLRLKIKYLAFGKEYDKYKRDISIRCYFLVAKNLNDEKICYYIPEFHSLRDDCFNDIALQKKDYSLCDESADKWCYHRLARYGIINASDCERINNQDARDLCYFGSIEHNEDIKICEEKIEIQIYRNECYARIAVIKKDPSICERIQEGEYGAIKYTCIEDLNKLLNTDNKQEINEKTEVYT